MMLNLKYFNYVICQLRYMLAIDNMKIINNINPNHKAKLRKNVKVKINVNLQCQKPEAGAQRCSVKKVFLEISQNSQENTCARVSF